MGADMTDLSKTLDKMMEEVVNQTLYGGKLGGSMSQQSVSTCSTPQGDNNFSYEMLLGMMDKVRAASPEPIWPSDVHFLPDYILPKDHVADEAHFIKHHPAHTKVAKLLNPDAPTATVMQGEKVENSCAYVIDGRAYLPDSWRDLMPSALKPFR